MKFCEYWSTGSEVEKGVTKKKGMVTSHIYCLGGGGLQDMTYLLQFLTQGQNRFLSVSYQFFKILIAQLFPCSTFSRTLPAAL
jgi:hypothetical protein